MRMGWTWFWLTEKRLWKKPGYLLVLLLVPILAWSMRIAAREEAGMLTIGLCSEEQGGFSEEIMRELMEEDGVLRYIRYSSEQEAIDGVCSGVVHAAWVFPEGLDEKLRQMAERGRITPIVRVVEREDDISLVFSREVLCSRLFPKLAFETYKDFVHKNLRTQVADETLYNVYRSMTLQEQLFEARHLDGTTVSDVSYLLSPLRGVLAIWLVVCGLAAVMFYQKDLQDGVYDGTPARKRIFHAVGLQAVVLGNGGVIFMITMGLLGVFGDPARELVCLLLFLGCVGSFCLVLWQLLIKIERIGALIPLLIVCMMVLCPVFFTIELPLRLQGILPPYFYLLSLHDGIALWRMAVYLGIGGTLCAGIHLLRTR